MPTKTKGSKKRRTKVKELPVAEHALNPKEMKNVKGGLKLPYIEQDNLYKQRTAEIQDGTSNTLLFSEGPGSGGQEPTDK